MMPDNCNPPIDEPYVPHMDWDVIPPELRGKLARRHLALHRAEQAIDNGETPELDALFIVLGEPRDE